MQKASETLIPVTLELGGKDAFIVCEDVDLPCVCFLFSVGDFCLYYCNLLKKWVSLFFVLKVVQVAVRAALQSSGQNCAGAERFYVHKDIYPEFVAQIVKVIKSISVVSIYY